LRYLTNKAVVMAAAVAFVTAVLAAAVTAVRATVTDAAEVEIVIALR